MENIQMNQQQLAYGELVIEEMAVQYAELVKQITLLKVNNKLLVEENNRLYQLIQESQTEPTENEEVD